jgi:hypothetical protein
VEWGDILVLAAGIAIVIIIALTHSPHPATETGRVADMVAGTPGENPAVPPTVAPEPTRMELFRIRYTNTPHRYETYLLPKNMSVYGGSDPPWPYHNSTTFAYMEESSGGVTEPFSVSSPLWMITCTIESKTSPQYASFQMVLVEARNGTIIEGAEIRYPGSVTKVVYPSDQEYYFIVGCSQVDRFTITLEAPSQFL